MKLMVEARGRSINDLTQKLHWGAREEILGSWEKSNGAGAERARATEKDLYTADTWSLLITEPCDSPRGALWSSVSLPLPATVHACLRGCRHAVCVSQRVK